VMRDMNLQAVDQTTHKRPMRLGLVRFLKHTSRMTSAYRFTHYETP
jgi:hypothetical protein